MPNFVVIYIKVRDNGDSITCDGPFVGKQATTMEEAKNLARCAINDSRHTLTIPSIFEIEDDLESTIEKSRKYFNRVIKNMTESKEIMNRSRK